MYLTVQNKFFLKRLRVADVVKKLSDYEETEDSLLFSHYFYILFSFSRWNPINASVFIFTSLQHIHQRMSFPSVPFYTFLRVNNYSRIISSL